MNVLMKIVLWLTLLRIIVIPIFVTCYYFPSHWSGLLSAILFALASITDWLDGFLARRFHQVSKFGEFLDPVADKLIVVVSLILMVANPHLPYITIPVVIIVCREITVSALREWMAELGNHAKVKVVFIGKLKTTVQMVAIGTLLIVCTFPIFLFYFIGYVALYLAAALTLWSMIIYLRVTWPIFIENS